jgi:AbrB family looped-hinge helix DNA binding protein
MNATVTLDKAGRVVLPKMLRDDLRLEPGDSLELESEGERVTLRPLRSQSPLRKERGVWVFHSGRKLAAAVTDKNLLMMVRKTEGFQDFGRTNTVTLRPSVGFERSFSMPRGLLRRCSGSYTKQTSAWHPGTCL